MNRLPVETRVQILSMLCEGSSMRAISRVADVSINTVSKLLVDAGNACAAFHDEKVRASNARRVQCDEIWSFCYEKQTTTSGAIAARVAAMSGRGPRWTPTPSSSFRGWSATVTGNRALLYAGREGSAGQSRPTHHGRPQGLSGSRRAGVRRRCRLRDAGEALRRPELWRERRYSPSQCIGTRTARIRAAPTRRHVQPRMSSVKTSPCG